MDATTLHTTFWTFPMTRSAHLDAGMMAAYLERTCDDMERSRIEAHLAECTDCCEELVAVDETLRTLPGKRRSRVAIPIVGLAAAAALVGLLVFRPSEEGPGRSSGEPPILQRSQPEARPTIAIRAPETGAVVEARDVSLRWAPIEPDARYLLTVTTAEGDSVWELMTADTSAAVPIALEPGGEYLWYVDALLPDGSSASSGVHHFRVTP
jgi:hypothetical protein